MSGISSIGAGESVIFLEITDLATIGAAFLGNWFGGSPPASLRLGSYSGTGIGLSTAGDHVDLNNAGGVLQTSVAFGTSATGPFRTFDNAAGLNNAPVTQLSATGVNAAFATVNDSAEIGSPGETPSVNDAPVAIVDSLSSIVRDAVCAPSASPAFSPMTWWGRRTKAARG